MSRRVRETMEKSAAYFMSISTRGGYVGSYSVDLKKRYGDYGYNEATPTEIKVQSYGTPNVGLALLRAYRITGDKRYLDGARGAGRALAWGQWATGGWDYKVSVSALQQDSVMPQKREGNHGNLDDEITQGAVEFLMKLDEVLDEPWLTESIKSGLDYLLRAQFPNGAWPQRYPLVGGYQDYYTFNDEVINDCIRVMRKASEQYGEEKYLRSACLGGDFIVLSQLPSPQAGWAQQYSHDLKPAQARAFEPAAICSEVTARNIGTLVDLYLRTRDKKYLAGIPEAISWLERSRLGPNLWARLYEIGSNRPIYGNLDGKVHYDLNETNEKLRGYRWQHDFNISIDIRYYQKVASVGAERFLAEESRKRSVKELRNKAQSLAPKVQKIILEMDEKGRWIRDNLIQTGDFVNNFNTLCEYLELTGQL